MDKIVIEDPVGGSFLSQMIVLCQTLGKIDWGNKNSFDFSKAKSFLYPLILLPLGVYINESRSHCVLSSESDVLIQIKFPEGADSRCCLFGKYLPIVHLTNNPNIRSRDNLICAFVERLKVDAYELKSDALFYPITELLNNVFEHSKKDEGWIFARIDKTSKFIDICIVDSGRGLRKSYLEEESLNISHLEAIGQAMIGHSTKKDKDRGYGLLTTKRLICKGLMGSFLMMTGNAVLIAEGDEEKVMELDNEVWNGVILACRIPLVDLQINIYEYIE